MKLLTKIYVVMATASVLIGQRPSIPSHWTGMWALNVPSSTFGPILTPGAAANLKIISQTLRIGKTAREIKLSGDSIVSDSSGGSRPVHDENSLDLDGKVKVMGPVTLSFRRIDELSFEIVSTINSGDRTLGEVSRFLFSPDRRTLTETKVQTQKEASKQGHETPGAAKRTSRFVLVFDRVSVK